VLSSFFLSVLGLSTAPVIDGGISKSDDRPNARARVRTGAEARLAVRPLRVVVHRRPLGAVRAVVPLFYPSVITTTDETGYVHQAQMMLQGPLVLNKVDPISGAR